MRRPKRIRPALIAAAVILAVAAFAGDEPALRRPEGDSAFEYRVRTSVGILDAEHVLSANEITRLSESGCRVVRALGGRRYLVALSAAWGEADLQRLPVRVVSPIDPVAKLDPAARSAESEDDPMPAVRVLFGDEVSIERARAVFAGAGGGAAPGSEFGPFRSLSGFVPREAIAELAQRNEVLGVIGPRPPISAHNAVAAAVSSVTPLYVSPYGLSGDGVVLSMWDDGRTDTSHGELAGRVVAENTSALAWHPTHVAGTIAAAGLNASAKGMAPKAVVHQFDFNVGDWWTEKETRFRIFNPRADNNSWGYGGGWSIGTRTYWEWWGDELFGVYAFESAQIDKLTRDTGALVVFSAGNENSDTGPTAAPWPHYHATGSTVYCSSSDGTGSDCPVSTCGKCETSRHPADGPWDTINLAASSKDSITVGAVSSSKTTGSFSSRGPVDDGRVKPDVVADGVDLLSTLQGGTYGRSSGTSMAAPVVTGIAALVVEQWRRSMGGEDPAPEVIKALLTGTAEDLGETGPDYTYGFGLVNAKDAIDTILADGGAGSRVVTGEAIQGKSIQYGFDLAAGGSNRLTLVWMDPEVPLAGLDLSSAPLINDLDLEVVGPDSDKVLPFVLDSSNPSNPAATGANRVDTVEQVLVQSSSGGHYVAIVRGWSVPGGPQPFALVSTAEIEPGTRFCEDPYEPNDTSGDAWGMLKDGITVRPDLCDPNDVDYFQFDVDRSGPVSVELSASDSSIHATLMRDDVGVGDLVVLAGTKATIDTAAGSGSGEPIPLVRFVVRVAATGTIVSNGYYSVRASYPLDTPPRRRPVRRP